MRVVRSADHDLRDPRAAREAVDGADVVIHLAANVGGIGFNRAQPGAARLRQPDDDRQRLRAVPRTPGVDKLVSACTVCAYPKFVAAPFREDDLWDGYPEESNAPYGLAKKMMLVLSDAYRRQYGFDSCAPIVANLYGPNDNFDLENSHVIAGDDPQVRRGRRRAASETVTLWGTGNPSREFLYVDDAARGAAARRRAARRLRAGERRHRASRRASATSPRRSRGSSGFEGEIVWDTSRPDGQPKRYLDVTRARELMGFEAEVAARGGAARARSRRFREQTAGVAA